MLSFDIVAENVTNMSSPFTREYRHSDAVLSSRNWRRRKNIDLKLQCSFNIWSQVQTICCEAHVMEVSHTHKNISLKMLCNVTFHQQIHTIIDTTCL